MKGRFVPSNTTIVSTPDEAQETVRIASRAWVMRKTTGSCVDAPSKIVLGGFIAESFGYAASSFCATSCRITNHSTHHPCYPHLSHYHSFESVSSDERLSLTLFERVSPTVLTATSLQTCDSLLRLSQPGTTRSCKCSGQSNISTCVRARNKGIVYASATTLLGPALFYFGNAVLSQCPETLVENIEDLPRCIGILVVICPVVAFGQSLLG